MSEDTALTTIQTPTSVLAQATPVDETGLSDFIKMKPSRIALVQNTTIDPKGALPGQFLDSESGAITDKLSFVVLKMHQSRTFYKPGEKVAAGVKPICRSYDAIKPANDVPQRQSQSCQVCPRSQWNGGPSDCKLTLELAIATTEDQMPHYLKVGGKSISPMRKVLADAQKKIGFGKLASLHNLVITIGGIKDGTTQKMNVLKVEQITDEQAIPYKELFKAMKSGASAQDIIDAEEAADEAVESSIPVGEIIVPQQV